MKIYTVMTANSIMPITSHEGHNILWHCEKVKHFHKISQCVVAHKDFCNALLKINSQSVVSKIYNIIHYGLYGENVLHFWVIANALWDVNNRVVRKFSMHCEFIFNNVLQKSCVLTMHFENSQHVVNFSQHVLLQYIMVLPIDIMAHCIGTD